MASRRCRLNLRQDVKECRTCYGCHKLWTPSLVEQSSGLVARAVPSGKTSSPFGTPSLVTLSHLLSPLLGIFSPVGLGLGERHIQSHAELKE